MQLSVRLCMCILLLPACKRSSHTHTETITPVFEVKEFRFQDPQAPDSVTLVFEKYFSGDTLQYGCANGHRILRTHYSTALAAVIKLSASELRCPLYLNGKKLYIPVSAAYPIVEIIQEGDSLRYTYATTHKIRY